MRLEKNVATGELLMRIVLHVAVLFHAVAVAEDRSIARAKQMLQLSAAPDVEGALPLLVRFGRVGRAVRILGRKESAIRMGQVAQNIIERAASSPRVHR